MADPWNFITDFGDSSVTLGLAAFILVYLLSLERWRAAIAWLLAVTACGAGMALLKVLFRSCAQNFASADFTSASGHAAMSATVYGGFALLLAARRTPWQRLATSGVALALVAAIAVSRVILGAHQRLEVAVGLLVGLAAILLFRQARGDDGHALPPVGPIVGAVTLIALIHGQHWPIEDYLRWLAGLVRRSVPACS